jgi:hypothetical protein
MLVFDAAGKLFERSRNRLIGDIAGGAARCWLIKGC